MTTSRLTSREFNQDTGGAKRAARNGPVYITDRGRPAYVLLTFDDFEHLAARNMTLAAQLSQTPGVGNVDFEAPVSSEVPTPAEFD